MSALAALCVLFIVALTFIVLWYGTGLPPNRGVDRNPHFTGDQATGDEHEFHESPMRHK